MQDIQNTQSFPFLFIHVEFFLIPYCALLASIDNDSTISSNTNAAKAIRHASKN